ncbi:MAG: ribonuclease P protein component [Chitinophagaceae bacterium]
MPSIKTLNKNQRLKSRKTIDALFKAGRSFSVFPFRVLYLVESSKSGMQEINTVSSPEFSQAKNNLKGGHLLQTGFSAPSKNFKKAVDRNRIKRLTRESFRLNQTELQESVARLNIRLNLFLIYTGKELPNHELVTNKISVVLQSLIKKLNESHPSNT